jgi:hypothetical protein
LIVYRARLIIVVQGPKSPSEAVKLLRKAARAANRSWTVSEITDKRGRRRGKGSHVMWAVYAADGTELGRGAVTTHSGDMSWTVTRGFEADFEDLFGKGWMNR